MEHKLYLGYTDDMTDPSLWLPGHFFFKSITWHTNASVAIIMVSIVCYPMEGHFVSSR